MKPTIENAKINVYINPAKFKATQPDLTAEFFLAERRLSIALWEQTTQDGERTYYSGLISERGVSSPAVTKVKLYQFAQRRGTDPDYRGKEPISLGGQHYYLYGFWRRSPKGEGDIWLELEFTQSQRTQAPSPEAEKFRAQLLKKFGQTLPLTLTDSTPQKPEPAKRGFNFDQPNNIPF
jgi:hypothetical protein